MDILSIQTYIDSRHLLTSGVPVVVGLSGGADSVALLDILVRLGYKCIAAHCNFHLRGEESDRDELFARNFAEQMNVPFFKIDFDTEQYALEHSVSIEMAARDLRYDWFEQVRIQNNAQAIAVAHHRDDSVETLMLNLIRGTGIRGMTGIRSKNGFVVRPLLQISRNDIVLYLNERNIRYITDSTNLLDAYTRNYIRLRVLPLLEEINPSVKASIARTAEHLSDAENIFIHVIQQAEKEVWQDQKLSVTTLMRFPSPKTILYELLRPYGFSRTTVDDIFQSLDKSSGKIFYSSAFRLIKDRDYLLIHPNKKVEDCVYVLNEETSNISAPIRLSFLKKRKDVDFQIEKSKSVACFDYNKLLFPLYLRRWQYGDWFIPFGMEGRKKLSDYFSDNKFSLAEKENCWLLCSGNNVLWIVGKRTDNRFRIDETTKNVFIVKIFDEIL